MKYVLFIAMDLALYPFLLLLFIAKGIKEKLFVPLLYQPNKEHTCTSKILSVRKI